MLKAWHPVGMQGSLIALSCIALQAVINRFGENVIAAFAATSRIEQLVQQPYNSLVLLLRRLRHRTSGPET